MMSLAPGWRPKDDDDNPYSPSFGTPGHHTLTLKRYEDTLRLREVITASREFLATTRFPWSLTLIVQPHGSLDDDMDEIASREGAEDEFDAESEREEWEDYRQREKERQAFLEREHRLRLQQELGGEINPKEYSPHHDAEEAEPGEDAPGGDAGGDVAAAAPDRDDEDDDSLGEDLTFALNLNEAGLWVADHARDDAVAFYGEPAEDWHALPEPPGERPSY